MIFLIFKQFGNSKLPVIILLHGGGLSWWSWEKEIELLQNKFCIVTPIIDGHGEDYDTTFISIEDSANNVINYIKTHHSGKVFAICGLSIGAQIVVEILSKENDITANAVIESALVCPMKFTTALTVPIYNVFYPLIKKRWYAKLQAKTLNVPDELFENYFQDSSPMTKETLINITKSNGLYSLSPSIQNTNANILILVGEKEISIMKKSAKLLHSTLYNSSLTILPKSGHGEISLLHPNEYVSLINNFFSKHYKGVH